MEQYDIIIIGTGAGGGTLAYKLASSGKKILILERGDFIPREKENWDPIEVFSKGRYRTHENWYDKDDQAFKPFTHYCVGGNTKMYGAALLRLRESDFQEVKHFDGISPAWPLSYQDLEPYYTEAEYLYSVHGEAGLDPSEPPRSKPYPFPAIPHEPRMKKIYEDIIGLGYRPAPIAIGIRLEESDGPSTAPINLSNFDGFPDLTEAKADSHVVTLRQALAHPNVFLKTNHKVIRLETDESGKKVNKIIAEVHGETVTYQGNVVVVSCGAVNSAALLLRSANKKHPNGLANSSDQVGRNYMIHNNGTVVAISSERNDSQFQKSFMLTDFYHGAEDSAFPLGAIQLMGKTDPDTLKEEIKDIMPDADIDEISHHSVDFFITAEDLPRSENRVTIREDGSIKTIYSPNNLEAYQRLREKLIHILESIGCHTCISRENAYVGFKLGVSGVSHQNGTIRFGTDPKTSVLDLNCKAHDLDNLYVVDGSFFPSSGAVNPSLTIMANALRVGEHLIKKMS